MASSANKVHQDAKIIAFSSIGLATNPSLSFSIPIQKASFKSVLSGAFLFNILLSEKTVIKFNF